MYIQNKTRQFTVNAKRHRSQWNANEWRFFCAALHIVWVNLYLSKWDHDVRVFICLSFLFALLSFGVEKRLCCAKIGIIEMIYFVMIVNQIGYLLMDEWFAGIRLFAALFLVWFKSVGICWFREFEFQGNFDNFWTRLSHACFQLSKPLKKVFKNWQKSRKLDKYVKNPWHLCQKIWQMSKKIEKCQKILSNVKRNFDKCQRNFDICHDFFTNVKISRHLSIFFWQLSKFLWQLSEPPWQFSELQCFFLKIVKTLNELSKKFLKISK